jgi:hypothetical protein
LSEKIVINKGREEEGLSKLRDLLECYLVFSDKARGVIDETSAIAYTKNG